MPKCCSSVTLEGLDKPPLIISKVTVIKKVDKEFIYLDRLPSGEWRLVYTEKTIPDLDALSSLLFKKRD